MSQFPYPSAREFAEMTGDEFEAFWQAFEKLEMEKTEPFLGRWFVGRNDLRDLVTLKRAGWKPEFVEKYSQPMAWYWRRPLRPGTRDRTGMLFKSTSQALTELRRMEARQSSAVQSFVVEVTIDGQPHRGTLPAKGYLNAQRMADSIGAKIVSTPSPPPTT